MPASNAALSTVTSWSSGTFAAAALALANPHVPSDRRDVVDPCRPKVTVGISGVVGVVMASNQFGRARSRSTRGEGGGTVLVSTSRGSDDLSRLDET